MQNPFCAPHLQRKGKCVLSALQNHTPWEGWNTEWHGAG